MDDKHVLAIFGAGKIGRSFIAQIFARNGYSVVFIDLDQRVIDALNSRKKYAVITLNSDGSQSTYWVENVSGISAKDASTCLNLLNEVSYVATSVGSNALPAVCVMLAEALKVRSKAGRPPFDLILAENMRSASKTVKQELIKNGLSEENLPGLIDASIGKTAPDPPAQESAADPLLTYADSYNTLILSAKGWKGDPPKFPEVYLAGAIRAYIDRKLFIHNLAHCAFAYFGYKDFPDKTYIHEVIAIESIRGKVERLVEISGQSLVREYPNEFSSDSMQKYIEGVFERMANPALHDSIWRVGRDIPRKLGRQERIVASMLLAIAHGLPTAYHSELYAAALAFRASDEHGNTEEADREFHKNICLHGLSHALFTISEFNNALSTEKGIVEEITRAICSC